MNNNFLIIVDMQNDFVTGSLGTDEAKSIVEGIKEYADNFEGEIIFTRDTHYGDYEETQEGRLLPVGHCMIGSVGWEIVPELSDLINTRKAKTFNKSTFGSQNLGYYIDSQAFLLSDDEYEEGINVYVCGVCTDICVISNALLIKAFSPEIKIHVLSSLCAGTTPEMHEKALSVMGSCLIDIM